MNDITPPQPGPKLPDGPPITPDPANAAPAAPGTGQPTIPTVTPPPAAQAATPPASATPAAPAPTVIAPSPLPAADEETANDTEPGAIKRFGAGVWSGTTFLLSWIVFPLAAVLVLHFFAFQAYHVVGTSMIETLHPSDYLIVSKIGYTEALLERDLLHKNDPYIPGRNQIIVFHYPNQPDLIFVKRVIGLPGDHVVISGGKVTVYNAAHPNGFDPNTGYEPAGTDTQGNIDEVIPAGNVFVLGDNRTPGGSFDSRDWGDLPSSYIIGNAVMRLLPLDQVKVF